MPAEPTAQEAPMTDPLKLAREALNRWQNAGCPDCRGDCGSANPPVNCCIMIETRDALAALDAIPQPVPVPADAELDALDRNADALLDLDAKHVLVPHGIGELARDIITHQRKALSALRTRLAEVEGAHTPERVLMEKIAAELIRARTKFPGKNVTFAALVEEVGELATATFEESAERVEKEAVQVAVMAMRMILDGDHCFDAWRSEKGLDHLDPNTRAAHRKLKEGK